MRNRNSQSKQKQTLRGLTRLSIFFKRKLFKLKEEILGEFTLFSPQTRSPANSSSLKHSLQNIVRPRYIIDESINHGLSAILGNDGLSVDFDHFQEPSYIKDQEDTPEDSPMRKEKKESGLNQKSMYFTYGDQLENQFTKK